jgi:hypothetical protein
MIGLRAKARQSQQSDLKKERRKGRVFAFMERGETLFQRVKQERIRVCIWSNRRYDVDHPRRRGHQAKVFPQHLRRPYQIDMRNPKQRVPGFLKQIQATHAEGFDRSPKATFLTTGTTGDASNFTQILSVQSNDSIGVAPLSAPQDNRRRLYQRHGSLPSQPRQTCGDAPVRVTGDTLRKEWPKSGRL